MTYIEFAMKYSKVLLTNVDILDDLAKMVEFEKAASAATQKKKFKIVDKF